MLPPPETRHFSFHYSSTGYRILLGNLWLTLIHEELIPSPQKTIIQNFFNIIL